MFRSWSFAAAVVLVVSAVPMGEAAVSDRAASEHRCAAKQLKAAGKSLSCRLKAHARSEKTGKGSASTESLAWCSDRLARNWKHLERRCEIDGDAQDLDGLLDSVSGTVAKAASSSAPMHLQDVALCVGDHVLHTENGCEAASHAGTYSWSPPDPIPGQPYGQETKARSCASRKLKAAAAAGVCLLEAEARVLNTEQRAETRHCKDKLENRFARLDETCGNEEQDEGPTAGQVHALMTNLQANLSETIAEHGTLALSTGSVCTGEGVAVVAGRCEAVSTTGNKNTVVMYDLIPDLKADENGNYSSLSYLSQIAGKPIDVVSSEIIWLASAADWPSDTNGGQWGLAVTYGANCKSLKKGACDPDYAARQNHGTCIKPTDWSPSSSKKCTEVAIPGKTISDVYTSNDHHFLPQVAMNPCWQALTASVPQTGDSITLADFWKTKLGQLCQEAQSESVLYNLSDAAIPDSTVFTYEMGQSWAQAAGAAVAAVVNDDVNTVGVSTDIEPPLKQPFRRLFHTSLAGVLNGATRFHTMWTGPESINLGDTNEIQMLTDLSANTSNYLTISFYDRGSNPPEPITPAMFATIYATQLGTGSCSSSDAQPQSGTWPATPGSASSTPAGVDTGSVCGNITHSAWQSCEDGYGNPMLPCPGSPHGLLARFSDNGLTNAIQVGLPFKATTSEWLFRQGPDSSNFGDTTAGAYPDCFRSSTEYYKTVSSDSNGDIVIQNVTAGSMGDYVAPALEVISDLRTKGTTNLVGIYAYGISPKDYLDASSTPFLDTIPTYVVDPPQIAQICGGEPITHIENYSYGTATDLTNRIDENTWKALTQWSVPE